jgi:hypothetical protein
MEQLTIQNYLLHPDAEELFDLQAAGDASAVGEWHEGF